MPSSANLSKRALITGITGQDGSYLAELLLKEGYEVFGMVRRSSSTNTSRIEHLLAEHGNSAGRIHLVYADLCDASSINQMMQSVRPDEIYNLAAQSHVQVSFEMPVYTGDVTAIGVARLLEGMRKVAPDARFYQASSSEMFGKVVESPQTESTPFYPRSPYGTAKAYAFYLTRNYRESFGTFATNGILFNHESPRRGNTFVTRKITQAVAQIKRGRTDPLRLGNLEARRDWGFAGDYVEAIWLMMQADQPDDFVIATGKSHSVRQWCELAFERVELPITWEGEGIHEKGMGPDGNVLIEIDAQYFRPSEVDRLIGDASKAKRDLGWEPKVGFHELVEIMVDADLNELH